MLAILVVLVAAIVYVLYDNFGDAVAGDSRARRNQLMHYQCTKCGHHFEISRKDFNLQHKNAPEYDKPNPGIAGKAHCPECKERFCSRMTSQCPHCGKYGVATYAKTGPDKGKQICPECKKVLDPAENTGPNAKRGRGR